MINSKFLTKYFSIDTRTLGLFRIVFGLVCLTDVIRRIPRIELFYSNNGIWANHFAIFAQGDQPVFSLLYAFSTPLEVTLFFIATLIFIFFFTIGYRTKVFHLLAMLFHISIINRTPILIYGGDTVMLIFYIWTFFLPLGRRLSLDYACGRTSDLFDKWNGIQKDADGERVYSLAAFACFLQIAWIYFITSLQKNGTTWREGSVVYYLLHQDRLLLDFGYWTRMHAPNWLLRVMSYGSLGIEYSAAWLIFSPFYTKYTRRLAIFLLSSFHLTVALFCHIGIFSFVMCASFLLLLPGEDAGRVERVLQSIFSTRILKPLTDRILSTLTVRDVRRDIPSFSLIGGKCFGAIRELGVAVVIFIAISHAMVANKWVKDKFPTHLPSWINNFVEYSSFREGWGMFSPEAPMGDYYLIFDAILDTGERIDLATGKPPKFVPVDHNYIGSWDLHWDSYTGICLPHRKGYLFELERWVRYRQTGVSTLKGRKIKNLTVWLLRDKSPPPEAPREMGPTLMENRKVLEVSLDN